MLAICCPHVAWQKTIRRTIPQHIPMKLTAFRGFRFTKALGLKHWGNCRALRGTPIELNWSSLAYPSSCHDNWGGKSLVFKHSHHVACIYVIIVRLCMYLSLSLSPCMYVTNYIFHDISGPSQCDNPGGTAISILLAAIFAHGLRGKLCAKREQIFRWHSRGPFWATGEASARSVSAHKHSTRSALFEFLGNLENTECLCSTSLIYSKYIPKKWWMIRTKPYTTTISNP